MSERSLFNVACKLLGLWLFFHAAAAFVWAFLASRFDHTYSVFDQAVDFGWSTGAVWLIAGAFLCCRSGWLTQLIFRVDPPLDTDAPDTPARRLIPGVRNTMLENESSLGVNPSRKDTDEP